MITRSPDDDRRSLAHCVFEMRVHLPGGRLIVHRSDFRVGIEGIAQLPLSGCVHHLIEECIVHALVHEHTFRRAAHLPRAEEAAEDSTFGSACQIGVLAHDHRPVATRLDQGTLEPCRTHDLLRCAVRAHETDAVDSGMGDERLPHVPSAVDDVHDPVRQPGVRHDLHEVRHRQRRPLRRLHHDRVPHRNTRRDQLDRNQRGEVPWRNRGVDAVRLPEGQDPFGGTLRRNHRGLHPLHVLGRDAEVLRRLVDVGNRLRQIRLALLE
jgi:hypothetical protein